MIEGGGIPAPVEVKAASQSLLVTPEAPAALASRGGGRWFADFGRAMFGTLRLTVRRGGYGRGVSGRETRAGRRDRPRAARLHSVPGRGAGAAPRGEHLPGRHPSRRAQHRVDGGSHAGVALRGDAVPLCRDHPGGRRLPRSRCTPRGACPVQRRGFRLRLFGRAPDTRLGSLQAQHQGDQLSRHLCRR